MKMRRPINVVGVLSVVFVLFLSGCGGGCGFWGNDAIWSSWDHFKFSAKGYKSPTVKDAEQSKNRQWWGCEVPVPASGMQYDDKIPKK